MTEINDRELKMLFSAPYVTSFDIDDRTGTVIYGRNSSEGRSLHMLVPGSDGEFTHWILSKEDVPYESPKLVYGDSRVVFLSDRGGDEKYDIFMAQIERKGKQFLIGDVTNLTPHTDYSILPPVSVDSSGKSVGFVSDRDGPFASFVLDIGSGKMERITHHQYSDSTATISPDGKLIAVSYIREGEENGISIFELGRKGSGRVMEEGGKPLDASSNGIPFWSGDSRALVFSGMRGDREQIGLMDAGLDKINWITDGRSDCTMPVISRDGKTIAYLREGSTSLLPVIVSLDGTGRIDLSETAGGRCHLLRLNYDGGRIFLLGEDAGHPTNLSLFDRAENRMRWLTESFGSPFVTDGFASPTEIRYPSEHDGLMIPALLYSPERANKVKAAVIVIHGGPTWRSYDNWDPLIQCLVGSGVTVVRPNYRGSSGYGRKFRDANRFVMGSADLADCAGAWKYLTEKGLASGKHIAVMGASFGGYLTMCSLVFYPERWCAGSATVPFLNWFTEMENEREDLRYWDSKNMGDPVKDAERLRNASPIFFLDRIRSPVQIIAGENDPRCPLSESLQAKEKLKTLGIKLDFKFYRGEGHAFEKMESIEDSQMRTYRFIRKHLFSQA